MSENVNAKPTLSLRALTQCAVFTALIAVGAYIKIPFFLMPITLQTLFTTLAGLVLGSKKGAIAVATYVVMGLLGLPVFVSGGGPGYVLQPTFGYLLGFIVGTWVAGYIVERQEYPSTKTYLIACFTNLVIYNIFGLAHFYFIRNFVMHNPMSFEILMTVVCLPYIPGDSILCLMCPPIVRRLAPFIARD